MIETLIAFLVDVVGGAILALCVWLWLRVPAPIRIFLSRVLILASLLVFWMLITTMASDLSGLAEESDTKRLVAWSYLLPLIAFGLSLRYRKTAREVWTLAGKGMLTFGLWGLGTLLVGSTLGYLGYRESYGVLAVSLVLSGAALAIFARVQDRREGRG